ncbi:MAG TPA: AIR synthase-related protein, partial [Candidatus Thermoplasmatota archaeon]|nr:AIR synthase-related protein [Candidatus Thermoplasmatota archaeon]
GLQVNLDAVSVDPVVAEACRFFGLDPYAVNSEGTLVITARAAAAEGVLAALREAGVAAALAGEVLPRKEGLRVQRGGRTGPLEHPRVDAMAQAWARLQAARSPQGPPNR